MKKQTKGKITLLHRHGAAAPGGKASYIKFGEYKTKSAAQKASRKYSLDGARYAKPSEVKKTSYRGLYYITGQKKKRRTTGFWG